MKSKLIFSAILSIFLIFTTTLSLANNSLVTIQSDSIETNNTDTENILIKDDLEILSESVILIDSKSGTVIYSKNENKIMYPASTTKVLTAILVLENGNLDDITTVSREAISSIPPGYSSAYLSEGEEISVKSLLEVLLIHSANDSANVLAEYISGSIDSFVDLMNQKATELGCTNTHFTNTNGIQDENHYSTASDLAIIAKYCMQNSTFRTLVAMKSCTIPATNKSEQRKYINTNDSIIESSEYYREDCIGIKTGYTSQAKNCLISACRDNDIELIAVLLYSPHLADRYADLDTLYEYGYKVYPLLNIPTENEELNIETETSISTESSHTNSSFKTLIQSNYFINILRILLIAIILLLLSIILFFNLNKKQKVK